jgi:hypothetical protein
MDTKPTIYEALVAAGVNVANHCSDLYFEWTPVSQAIRKQYPENKVSLFTSQDPADNKAVWCEIAFAYDPFWDMVFNKKRKPQTGVGG